jgi:hypothetical protein
MDNHPARIVGAATLIACIGAWALPAGATELMLFDFADGFDVTAVQTSDATAAVTDAGALRIETGHKAPWPGVTLKAPKGNWDLSPHHIVSLDVTNRSNERITVNCRVDNPGADGTNHCVTENVSLDPAATQTLTVRIFPVPWKLDAPLELVGMRAAPTHAGKLDTANITQLVIFLNHPRKDHAFEIDSIRASGSVQVLDAATFLPFIDEFGQYIHREWPGKTHSVDELVAHRSVEKKDLKTHPGPDDWGKYGGWKTGPRLDATGYFRVQKYRRKWWLVDPTGRLFWSHGIDCVHSGVVTPISDREHYFRGLPRSDSAFARFYGRGSWAPHGYYKDHSPYRTYDFGRANLLRKYGPEFEDIFADVTHRRLRSWGLNTIANWSSRDIYLTRRTPYVVSIHFEAKRLEGSQGYWGKFYYVFDSDFH